MASSLTQLTFAVTKEMESFLAAAQKNWFYDRSRSDMIRELVLAGLKAVNEKAAMEKQSAQTKSVLYIEDAKANRK